MILLFISVATIIVTMYSAYKGSNKALAIAGGTCVLWFMLLIIL